MKELLGLVTHFSKDHYTSIMHLQIPDRICGNFVFIACITQSQKSHSNRSDNFPPITNTVS